MVIVSVFSHQETLSACFAKNLSHLNYTYTVCRVTPTPISTETNYKLNIYYFPSYQKHKCDSSAEAGGEFS